MNKYYENNKSLKFEEKKLFLEELKIFSEENIIIVEGKKDREALKKYNIKSYSLKGNIDFFVEKILEEKNRSIERKIMEEKTNLKVGKNKFKVAILTDYDYRGEKLRRILKENFSLQGVEEEKKYRIKIKKLFRINHIENLKL